MVGSYADVCKALGDSSGHHPISARPIFFGPYLHAQGQGTRGPGLTAIGLTQLLFVCLSYVAGQNLLTASVVLKKEGNLHWTSKKVCLLLYRQKAWIRRHIAMYIYLRDQRIHSVNGISHVGTAAHYFVS